MKIAQNRVALFNVSSIPKDTQLTDLLYQGCRGKFSSRKEFRNQLRCTFRILIFRGWEQMLAYLFNPPPLEPP